MPIATRETVIVRALDLIDDPASNIEDAQHAVRLASQALSMTLTQAIIEELAAEVEQRIFDESQDDEYVPPID